MAATKKGKNKNTININLLFSSMKIRLLSVFTINLVTIGVFGVLGYFLDYQFGTKPLFLIVLLVLSFPVSIYSTIRKSKQLVEKLSNKKQNG